MTKGPDRSASLAPGTSISVSWRKTRAAQPMNSCRLTAIKSLGPRHLLNIDAEEAYGTIRDELRGGRMIRPVAAS